MIDRIINFLVDKIGKNFKYVILLIFVLLFISVLEKCDKDIDETIDTDIVENNVQEIIEENNTEVIENTEPDIGVVLLDDGYDIYDPGSAKGYRYGPSLIEYEDGSIDAWFARPGNNYNEWDYISYRHMDIDGYWSKEQIVLKPTAGSLDHYSCCDPGVIYFNGYYYLGYTSTTSSDALSNQLFVARSEYPDGPFEKWNGQSWGGDPFPIVSFSHNTWGAGEPSFVIKDDRLYIYYTWLDEGESSTRVMISDLSDNWPANMKFSGIAIYRKANEDSSDIVYDEESNLFLAFSVVDRMKQGSYLIVRYSYDGVQFEKLTQNKEYFKDYAHNLGIVKDINGHIKEDMNTYISYAYSLDGEHASWKTIFQGLEIR